MDLRRYQKQLTKKLQEGFAEQTKVCLQLVTGSGKTILFSHFAKSHIEQGHNVLILAHREELVNQAVAKLKIIIPDIPIGIIKAVTPANYEARIQVASVQSLTRRLANIDSTFFNLVIIDEAHHAVANTYTRILNHFSTATLLGVTATPCRLDGKGLDKVFDHLVSADAEGIDMSFLMRNKYLCTFRAYAAPRAMITEGVKKVGGDYDLKGLAEKNDAVTLSGDLIETYRQRGKDGSCIVFAINCDHSRTIVDEYRAAGYTAAHLDGKTPKDERRDILRKFIAGEIRILSNVGLFDEGFDVPSASVVQICRPTSSVTKHLQIIGRVLRRDGNKVAIIIDHTNNLINLGLPTRKREWTLAGFDRKQRDKYKAVKRDDGSIVEKQNIEHEEVKLKRIKNEKKQAEDRLNDGRYVLSELIKTKEAKGYKPGWLYYQLAEIKPSLDIWYEAAKYLDYKPTWAEINYVKATEEKVNIKPSSRPVRTRLDAPKASFVNG